MVSVVVAEKLKRNYYELCVISIVKQLSGVGSIDQYGSDFQTEITKVHRKGISYATNHYRLKWIGDRYMDMNAYLEIWHIDNDANYDRLIATIKSDQALKIIPLT